ncbi:unnamed protein product, partial [Porites evermanni]
ICIQGRQEAVGCDHLLNSNKVIDRCGVCGGKADSCIDETADFTEQIANAGESALIKKIPPGTTYAHFRKRSGATSNVIGIQDVYENYLINVPDVFTTTITYAGATIFYKHTKARYQDILEISGQTTETL